MDRNRHDIPQYQRKKMRKIGTGRKPYYADINRNIDQRRLEYQRRRSVILCHLMWVLIHHSKMS